MSNYKVEVFSKDSYELGEGPHWDGTSQYLYFVDLLKSSAYRLDTTNKNVEKLNVDNENKNLSFIIPCQNDKNEFMISRDNKLVKANWVTKSSQVIAEVDTDEDGNRFNDGKCDAKGRLWAGTMGSEYKPGFVQPDKGSLYCLDGFGKVSKKVPNISLSNGLTWSIDNKKMFYIDSTKRVIYVFDFDLESGNLSNQKVLVDFNKKNAGFSEKELPDGMTIDKNGKLWVACFFGGRVLKIDPDTGEIIDQVKLPAERITSVCFGGPKLDQLYVTSAYFKLTEEERKQQPLAGHIFVVTSTDPSFGGAKPHTNYV